MRAVRQLSKDGNAEVFALGKHLGFLTFLGEAKEDVHISKIFDFGRFSIWTRRRRRWRFEYFWRRHFFRNEDEKKASARMIDLNEKAAEDGDEGWKVGWNEAHQNGLWIVRLS